MNSSTHVDRMSLALLSEREATAAASLQHLVRSLRRHFPELKIVRIHRQQLIEGGWQDAQALLVPGGRDFLYQQSLGRAGTDAIRRYVEAGGRYFGICAGAYLASSRVHFGIGGSTELWSPRSLHLFPGIAQGPALQSVVCPVPYDFYSNEHCQVVPLLLDPGLGIGTRAFAYYNAGPCFIPLPAFGFTSTVSCPFHPLAHYEQLNAPSHVALVESWPGKGYALLSGIHPEFSADAFKVGCEFDRSLYQALLQQRQSIDLLFQSLMRRLLSPPLPPEGALSSGL